MSEWLNRILFVDLSSLDHETQVRDYLSDIRLAVTIIMFVQIARIFV